MKLRTCLGLLLAGLLSEACALEPARAERLGSEQAAVAGGEASTAEDDAVVQTVVSYGHHCTATLVAPNVIVTALHCVAAFSSPAGLGCNPDGTSPQPGSSAGRIGAPLDTEDIEVFVGAQPGDEPSALGKQVFGSGSQTICSNDIALVVLDRALPHRGLPIRVGRPVLRDEELTLVGYSPVADSPFHRRRRRNVPVLWVGPDEPTGEPSAALPKAFLVGDGPCNGDEGGPALSEETGAIVGIFSHTASGSSADCQGGLRNIYTQVSPFAELFDEALVNAGHELRIEAETNVPPIAPAQGGCSFVPWRFGTSSAYLSIMMLVGGFCLAGRGRHWRKRARATRHHVPNQKG